MPLPAISVLFPFYSPRPCLFDFLSPRALAPSFLSLSVCLFSSHLNWALLRLPAICTSFPLFFPLCLLSPALSFHPNLPHFIAYLFPSIPLPRFSFHQSSLTLLIFLPRLSLSLFPSPFPLPSLFQSPKFISHPFYRSTYHLAWLSG